VQVREVRCHYLTATGPCAARSMAQQLWAGEEYVLQLDAHMRFVQVRQRFGGAAVVCLKGCILEPAHCSHPMACWLLPVLPGESLGSPAALRCKSIVQCRAVVHTVLVCCYAGMG
jgi:hypothetical protein